jgi:hypothetical protein
MRSTAVANEDTPTPALVSRKSVMSQNSLHIVPLEPFVNAVVAGGFLGIHPVTVRRFAREGRLPGHPVSYGNGVRMHQRFLLSELREWLKSRNAGSDRPGGL